MKTELSFTDIDKVDTEAIVLLFFDDERPLRGAAGIMDWRMNGAISNLIMNNKIRGEKGESILLLPNKRIKGKKVLMMGLGDSSKFTESTLKKTSGEVMNKLLKIGVKKFHLAIPSKELLSINAQVTALNVTEGIKSIIEKNKINDSDLSLTLSIDESYIKGVDNSLDILKREVKGLSHQN